MNVQLTVVQLWALVAGGPIAMVLTVLVGILVNNAVTGAKIEGIRSDLQRVEGTLRSEILRVEAVLSEKIDSLTLRVKALEEAFHSPLVKQ